MSILRELSCPNCLAPIDLKNHGSSIKCHSCQSQFILEGHLCPECNAYYKDEVAACGRCGTAMSRTCAKCHTSNWAGDEYCKSCGQAMDLLDIAVQSHHEQMALHTELRRAQIRDIRAQGEANSKKRMEEMMRAEKERIAEYKERQEQKRRRDIMLFFLMGCLIIGVIMIMLYAFFAI